MYNNGNQSTTTCRSSIILLLVVPSDAGEDYGATCADCGGTMGKNNKVVERDGRNGESAGRGDVQLSASETIPAPPANTRTLDWSQKPKVDWDIKKRPSAIPSGPRLLHV